MLLHIPDRYFFFFTDLNVGMSNKHFVLSEGIGLTYMSSCSQISAIPEYNVNI